MSSYRKRLERLETKVLWGTAMLPAMFVLLLVVLRWPAYWKWINYEMTPMTSLEVAVMFTAALMAFMVGTHAWLKTKSEYHDWWLLAAGFVYFALDDRFAIHERIRDNILIPNNIALPFIPWMGMGDFILLTYAVIGIVLLPRISRLFQGNTKAMRRLFAAVCIALIAMIMDSVDIIWMSEDTQRLEQTLEECLELTAQILFLHAFIITFFAQLAREDAATP